ncbi:hypothetical protein Pmani_017510 [Petrolisthes manimaculis]|uniref:Uncharacterized protein n=1 Tax=Petrolisthes manimaculis TaxID=1843537 RepID=A0AAE1U9S3_9EUCA|nr:hypothetical protein Pmani_017510 [Petrolisthes manimaculis]
MSDKDKALLSVLAVSTLSLPRKAENGYNIPKVGTGHRSQYYIQQHNGGFKYGHDTGDGAYEMAHLNQQGQRQDGQYGYRDPDGNLISVRYEAGEGGFRPVGDHIPQPHPDFHAAHAEARARPTFVDPFYDCTTDASYDFNYAEGGQARQEQSDSVGNVRGSYSYIDDEGRTRSYNYIAGRDTGFVLSGDDLPEAPLVPGATPAATSLATGASVITASSFRPSSSLTGFTSSHRRPSHRFTSSNAWDHSRSDSGDANPKVDGLVSFVSDEGGRRHFIYEAGSGTGFAASGNHLPRVPTSPLGSHSTHRGSTRTSAFHRTSRPRPSTHTGFSSSRPSSTSTHTGFSSSRPSSTHTGFSSSRPSSTHTGFSSSRPSTHTGFSSSRPSSAQTRFSSTRPDEVANTRSSLNPDGSYAFAYETSSHSRAEAGDSSNNVDGEFDFVADDGQERGIKYEAGSDTGFIAEGAHIPVGPPVPGAPSGQPTGRIVPVQEVPFIDPLADSNTDASYSFGFESEQYSRTESADADGNVQGTYTVVDDDGTRRTYRFRAGQGVGYEAEEVSSTRGAAPSKAAAQAGATSFFSNIGGVTSSHSTKSSGSRPSVVSAYSPSASSASTTATKASLKPSTSRTKSYKVRQYNAAQNHGKYGYVLTFDR